MKVGQRLIFSTVTWNTLIFNADSVGNLTRLQCGITAVYSTMLPGIISLRYGMVIVSLWRVMRRFSEVPVVCENQRI